MADGNSTNTIDPADVKNSQGSNSANNSQPQLSKVPVPQDNGGGVIPNNLLSALYSGKNGLTLNQVGVPAVRGRVTQPPQAKETDSATKKTASTIPVREIAALNQPAILNKLVPDALKNQIGDQRVTEETLKSIGLGKVRQAKAPPAPESQNKVEIKPIKVSSTILDQIEKTQEPVVGDIGLPPVERRPSTTDLEKVDEDGRPKTKSEQDAAEKFKFGNETLADVNQIPGSPKLRTKAKSGERVQGATEAEGEEKKKPRRRLKLRTGSATVAGVGGAVSSGGGMSSGGGEGGGGSTASSGSSGRTNVQAPRMSSSSTGGAQPLQSSQIVDNQNLGTSAPQQPQASPRQQSLRNRIQDTRQQIQDLPNRVRGQVDELQDRVKRAKDIVDKVQKARGTFDRARNFFRFGRGASRVGRFFGLGSGTAAPAAAPAAGTAAGAGTLGLIGVGLLALVVVALILVLIYVVSTLASVDEAARLRAKEGNTAAFFKRFDVQGGNNITSGDIISNSSVTVIKDAAGNVTEIRLQYIYELNPKAVYNKNFLGENSNSYIEVGDMQLQSQLNLPKTYQDASGGNVKLGFPDGYDFSVKVAALQPYPNIAVSGDNLIAWQPAICGELAGYGDGQSQLADNPFPGQLLSCRPRYTERVGILIKFKQPLDPAVVNNRLQASLEGSLKLNYYDGPGGEFLGPQTLPINPITSCFDLIGGGTIPCESFQNDPGDPVTGGGGTAGPLAPSNGTGVVTTSCPAATLPGDKLDCTNSFYSTGTNASGSKYTHGAVDMNVKNAAGIIEPSRQLVSPVQGKIIAVNDKSYYEACGYVVTIQSDDDPSVVYEFHHLEWKNRVLNPYQVGQTVGKDQPFGTYFDPGNDSPRSYGGIGLCWFGKHTHYVVKKNGVPIDPEADIKRACKAPLFICPVRNN